MAASDPTTGVLAGKIVVSLLPGFAVGLIGYGFLRSDVATIKAQQAQLIPVQEQVIRLDERVKGMREDLSDIKAAVKSIETEVKK